MPPGPYKKHLLGHSGSNNQKQSTHLKRVALQTVFKRENMKPQRGKHETLNALAAAEDLSFSSVQLVSETCNDESLLAVSVRVK